MYKTLLYDQLTPVALYGQIRERFNEDVTMLFESVVNTSDGNFSFIAIGVQERLRYKDGQTDYIDGTGHETLLDEDPFSFLKSYYQSLDKEKYQRTAQEVGFSFVDGFIGFIAYDMVKVFEPVLEESMDGLTDPLQTPDLDLIRPRIILAYSHKSAKLTMILNDDRAKEMFAEIESMLQQACTPMPIKAVELEGEGSFSIGEERFKQMVDEAKEHIRSGDIFQILLSNRYTQRGRIDPLSFYRVLRSKNPSPYLFLLEYEDFSICGSSPEVMVRLTDNEILLRPIAGTRKRGRTHQRDRELEDLPAFLVDVVFPVANGGFAGRAATASGLHVEEVFAHTIDTLDKVEDPVAGLPARLQQDGTGRVAEQDAGGAVWGVDDAAHDVRADHQDPIVAARFHHLGAGGQRKNEP